MTKSSKKNLIVLVVLAIAGLTIILFYWMHRPKDFRHSLANSLNVAPDDLTINFPPAYGRYPGALLLRGDHGQIIPISYEDRPDSSHSIDFDLSSALITEGDLGLAGNSDVLSEALNMNDKVEIQIKLKNGKVFEKSAEELKRLLAENSEVEDIVKKGITPEIISRTYEAQVEVLIKRKSGLDEKVWQHLRLDAAGKSDTSSKISIEAKGDDELIFSSKKPLSIAFETLSASWVANNLGNKGEPDILLNKKIVTPGGIKTTTLSNFGLLPKGDSILFVPLISEKYNGIRPASIPFAEQSARAIGEVFKTCGAEVFQNIPDPLTNELTTAEINNIIEKVKTKLSSHQYSTVIFYYVGHAFTSKADSILLILGDYDSASATKGIYPLADLYEKVNALNIPFSILIDGCFTNEGFDELKQALHLTASLDYFGTENNAYEAISRYAEAQSNFPRQSKTVKNFPELSGIDKIVRFMEFGYLLSPNPVIFAAKPGELAFPRSNPSTITGNRIAPLAWKATRMLEVDVSKLMSVSLGEFLRSLVDFHGSGEISARGTCSWSEFEKLNTVSLISDEKYK